MTIEEAKQLLREREAEREQLTEEQRRRDAEQRRLAFGAVVDAVDRDVLGGVLFNVCERPIVRLGQGDYERRFYR